MGIKLKGYRKRINKIPKHIKNKVRLHLCYLDLKHHEEQYAKSFVDTFYKDHGELMSKIANE